MFHTILTIWCQICHTGAASGIKIAYLAWLFWVAPAKLYVDGHMFLINFLKLSHWCRMKDTCSTCYDPKMSFSSFFWALGFFFYLLFLLWKVFPWVASTRLEAGEFLYILFMFLRVHFFRGYCHAANHFLFGHFYQEGKLWKWCARKLSEMDGTLNMLLWTSMCMIVSHLHSYSA